MIQWLIHPSSRGFLCAHTSIEPSGNRRESSASQPERYLGKKREGSLIIDDHAAAQLLPRAVVGLSIWLAVEVSETHSVSPWVGTSQKLWHQ